MKDSIRAVVKDSGVDPKDVQGIGLSGLYGGSGVPVDKDMNPVRPDLIWMDRRAAEETQWVKDNVDLDRLSEITGNDVVDPYYGYTKVLWIKNHEPENWKKTALFLPPNNYAIYKLTGAVSIDYSAAGNIGGFYDINKGTWSKEMMDAMGVPMDKMPQKFVDATEVAGRLTKESAEDLGLPEGLPVIAGGVDVGAANIGMGVLKPGRYVAAIGSSMNAALVSETPIKARA